jgi:hypothetical protein
MPATAQRDQITPGVPYPDGKGASTRSGSGPAVVAGHAHNEAPVAGDAEAQGDAGVSPSQKGMLAADFEPVLAKEAAARQKAAIKERDDKGRAVSSGGKPATSGPTVGKAREQAGQLFGVSGRSVSDAKQVKAKDPELAFPGWPQSRVALPALVRRDSGGSVCGGKDFRR